MLVVISDLHLQEVSREPMRTVAREDSARNVSAEALNLLFEEIRGKVIEHDLSEVVLCLAGDIFEINRSMLWFEASARPYHDHLPPDHLEPLVLKILDRIAEDNADFFAALSDFVKHKTYRYHGDLCFLEPTLDLILRYLPGNHDRLVNHWPSTRRRVRELLGLSPATEVFDHEFVFPNHERVPSYGVLIRHGHEYDKTNFAQSAARKNLISRYSYACLGDVITLEFVAYFPYRFNQLYGEVLRGSNRKSDLYQHLYAALLDFDDVRPAASLFAYLMSCLKSAKTKAHELQSEERAIDLLRPILLEAFDSVSKLRFFRKEVKSVTLRLLFLPPVRNFLSAALRWLPASVLGWGLNKVGVLRTKVEADSSRPALEAAKEEALTSGRVHTVVAGHTHHPDQIPLHDGNQFFLDSGTWRTLIYQGEDRKAFGRLRAITYIFCYRSDEGQSERRFETWTGHLSSVRHNSFEATVPLAFDQVS